jgi:hypothetical protein
MRAGTLLTSLLLGRRNERGGEFFVEGKEELHPLPLALEGLRPIASVHGPVEGGMVTVCPETI